MSLSRATRSPVPAATVCAPGDQRSSQEPAIVAWKAWRAARRRTLALCRRQQHLETVLARTIGFPHVVVHAPELPSPIRIEALSEFDEITATLPSIGRLRGTIAAQLGAHQARWDDADQAVGYSYALEQEELSLKEETQLAEVLLGTTAGSIPGITAKLDAVIAIGATSDRCREFPWPQLRRLRSELGRLTEAGPSDHTYLPP